MSGVRLNGFLASTAVALLLSAGGTFAQFDQQKDKENAAGA